MSSGFRLIRHCAACTSSDAQDFSTIQTAGCMFISRLSSDGPSVASAQVAKLMHAMVYLGKGLADLES